MKIIRNPRKSSLVRKMFELGYSKEDIIQNLGKFLRGPSDPISKERINLIKQTEYLGLKGKEARQYVNKEISEYIKIEANKQKNSPAYGKHFRNDTLI